MGSNDVPPGHAPLWLIPASTGLLGIGVACWCVAYILMTREALRTHIYGMPIPALVVNVAWEAVYFVLAVSDVSLLEAAGIFVWLLFDISLVYTTLMFSENTRIRRSKSHVAIYTHQRDLGLIRMFVVKLILIAVVCHWVFANWWLSTPGHGCGDKAGKFWQGREGYDVTELAFWTASACQLVTSTSSLSMLWRRQDARGTSMPVLIWRMAGSVAGLGLANGILWYYWPEAHCYFSQPMAVLMNGTSLVCDIAYGCLLHCISSVGEVSSVVGEDSEAVKQGQKNAGTSAHVWIRS